MCEFTYPVSTDSNVEDDEERLASEGGPDSFVVDSSTVDLEELAAVQEPGDGLIPPGALASVNVDAVDVPAVVGDTSVATDTTTFVTDTAGVDVAVDGSKGGQLAADLLEDVDLTAAGPGDVVTDRVSQHPEGGPDALLLVGGGGAHAELGFDSGELVGLGGEGVLGLDTARGPSSLGATVPPGNELEGLAAAELDVAALGRVRLPLVVDVHELVDDVPVVAVGLGATVSVEVVLPDEVQPIVLGSLVGEGGADGGEEREKDFGKHIWLYIYK